MVGFSPRHLSPKDLRGNRFTVVLREVEGEEVEALREAFEGVLREGFPNYFDLQRFGSWSPKEGFPGKALLKGDWERVLKFYLLWPMLGDPREVRAIKERARDHWGDWPYLKGIFPRSNQRSVLSFLCDHPGAFREAVNLISPRILSLWLSAYQAYLWNEVAKGLIRRRSRPEDLIPLGFPFQELLIPIRPPEGVRGLDLPLPSHRSLPEGEAMEVLGEVLREEGLTPEGLRAKGLKRAYLPKGRRPLWVVPLEGRWLGVGDDRLYPGKREVRLSFVLPPGSYGTMLLRVLSRLCGSRLVVGGEEVPTGLHGVEGLGGDLDEGGEPAGHPPVP